MQCETTFLFFCSRAAAPLDGLIPSFHQWCCSAMTGARSPQRSCNIRGSFIMMAVSWSKATVISGRGGSGRLGSDALFVLCIWRFISRHYSGFQCSLLVPCCTAWTIFTLCDLLLVSSCGLEWITLEVLQKYVFVKVLRIKVLSVRDT